VQATAQLSATRNMIADVQAALDTDGLPDRERFAALATRASASGSWVAASKMIDLLVSTEARENAAAVNASLRAAAVAPDATAVDFHRAVLAELMLMQSRETGIAKIQALKEAEKAYERLNLAIEEAKGQGEMTNDEIVASITDQIPDIPDEHLALYVRGYCERHKLPMPHRSVSGGRAN
jgi:hypothetical protein